MHKLFDMANLETNEKVETYIHVYVYVYVCVCYYVIIMCRKAYKIWILCKSIENGNQMYKIGLCVYFLIRFTNDEMYVAYDFIKMEMEMSLK